MWRKILVKKVLNQMTRMITKKDAVEDDEYVRIMSRLDELEKEELEAEDEEVTAEDDDESNVEKHDAAENNDGSDTDEQTDAAQSDSESHENTNDSINFHIRFIWSST